MDRMALVTQPAEQCGDQFLVSEEGIPAIIFEVGCYYRCLFAIAFFHQFEKDVRLLWAEI